MWRITFSFLSNGAGPCHGSVETGTVLPEDLPHGGALHFVHSTLLQPFSKVLLWL